MNRFSNESNGHHNRPTSRIRKTLALIICLAVLLAGGKLLINQAGMNCWPDKLLTNLAKVYPFRHADTEAAPDTRNEDNDWNLILVNRWNHIPGDYQGVLVQLSNGQSVDARIYPDLQAMFNAARADGIYPVVVSGYRTAEEQQSLMDVKIAEYKEQGCSAYKAKYLAEKWVAIPGTSEHQLGIAVDINADTDKSTNDQVYQWLNSNSYKYGFILRYPSDKTKITGTIYEPWHYRYVGMEAAEEIYAQGLCLEEYLEQ
jgi:D-alanyl-D-alanine carboxypeptidase